MRQSGTTICGVFADKCRSLAKDSSGAALAITLAFVAPLYLTVIGIYAIGEIVRNKIEIQNAADAAAYSAAVVQADYVSRMATVNKAMAWTYVDLQKRSFDLAMDTFAGFVVAQFQRDFNMVREKNSPCHMHTPAVNYNCGTTIFAPKTILQFTGMGAGIPELATDFNGQGLLGRFLLNHILKISHANLTGHGTLANLPKVLSHSMSIIKMTKKLSELKKEYPKKIRETAQQIAIANMAECKDKYYVNITLGNDTLSFYTMFNKEDDESDFISFADPTLKDFSPKKVFGKGTDDWIVRSSKEPVGLWRVYKQTKTHLYAKWDYFWTAWRHVNLLELQFHLPPIFPWRVGTGTREYHGYDSHFQYIKRDLPIGLLVTPALPVKLLPTFFGKSGSIVVSIVRKTNNPFSGIIYGRSPTAAGMLSAFNPSVAGGSRPEYMCAISAARAGFKHFNSDKDKKADSSDYSVGYVKASKNEAWNLCETDWDAVMLPVAQAWHLCAGGYKAQTFIRDPTSGNVLKDVILDKKNWIDKDGKKVSEKNLPDWEKLAPPGGLIPESSGSGKKLNWEKVADYLRH